MDVVIRVDASLQIGIGHVMRCLTLARALTEKNAKVWFICRDFSGNLIEFIKKSGFQVHVLEAVESIVLESFKDDSELNHSSWLGKSQVDDAQECKLILEKINPEWLVVDHYAIDFRWQKKLKCFYKKLMIIDDLADRYHDCDLLLDQTFGQKSKDYEKCVPRQCQLLLGAEFSLLRPEFSNWREYSLKRRNVATLKNIIVSMGGVDVDNVTSQVLCYMAKSNLPQNLIVNVIMGSSAPNLSQVEKTAKTMPFKTIVKVGVSNMAELMANADLAIGATGATTWERCCLGLPSIQVVVAENQKWIAEKLSSINAIECIGDISELPSSLKRINKVQQKMSLISSSIVDGLGCEKVSCFLFENQVGDGGVLLQAASDDDCDFIYSLQTAEARKYARNSAKPTLTEHIKWFKKTLSSESVVVFVIRLNNHPVGMLRYDDVHLNEVEVSIIVAPHFSGQGVAKKALVKSFELQPGKGIKAIVHKDNVPSQKLFKKLNFIRLSDFKCFVEYRFQN